MTILKCNLKDILQDKGVSQRQLSIAIAGRQNTISDLCNNKLAYYPVQLLADICEYLNIDIADLLQVVNSDV